MTKVLSELETKIEQLEAKEDNTIGDLKELISALETENDAQVQVIEQLQSKVEGYDPGGKLDKLRWIKRF